MKIMFENEMVGGEGGRGGIKFPTIAVQVIEFTAPKRQGGRLSLHKTNACIVASCLVSTDLVRIAYFTAAFRFDGLSCACLQPSSLLLIKHFHIDVENRRDKQLPHTVGLVLSRRALSDTYCVRKFKDTATGLLALVLGRITVCP